MTKGRILTFEDWMRDISGRLNRIERRVNTDASHQWESRATWGELPSQGNWPGRQIRVGTTPLKVAVWDGTRWLIDPVSNAAPGP